MTAKFIAEDVPAYSVEPWLDKPWRDEDCAMSARRTVAKGETEDECREALVKELEEWATYYREKAKYNDYYRKDFKLFSCAAAVLSSGSTAVKVHGRYHRVRPVNEHGF